jgi:hypothetical protein
MGFLTPWFLAGLAALGIPVFVHLLRKHVTIPRPISSLMFFERGIQSSTRHRRLKHLLLFALRFLVILLLVLAFANPFLRRRSDPAGSLLLIALDNSFSMRAEDHFEQARREALELLSKKPRAQKAQIVVLGGQSRIFTEPTDDINQLKTATSNLQVEDGHANFADLARLVRGRSETFSGPIELHLFSDVQRTAMPNNFSEVVLPSQVTLTLHHAGSTVKPNWTIEDLNAPVDLTDTKDPAISRVKGVLVGFTTPDAERTISLLVNGKVISQKKFRVGANGQTPVEFSPLDVGYGFNQCALRIEEEDALAADNLVRFAVRRLDPRRVLFVSSLKDKRSAVYFEAALNAATHGAYILQPILAEQTSDIDPTKFAFTVLADTTHLPSIFLHTLEEYVSKGGNVLISLGLGAEHQTHLPLGAGAVQTSVDPAANQTSVGQIDFTFPVLEQEHPSRDNGGWGAAKFYFAPSVDAPESRVVARLSDGRPLLLDRKIGEGHVLLFASGFDGISNDLPLQPVFVSFVDRAARYLSGSEHLSATKVVDSFEQLRSAPAKPDETSTIEIIDPDGNRPLSLTEAKTLQTFRLSRAGFYKIRFSNGHDDVVGVNPDPKESDLTPITPEIQRLWLASNNERPATETQPANQTKYQRQQLWWYVMLLALAFTVAEAFFSSRYLKIDREEI